MKAGTTRNEKDRRTVLQYFLDILAAQRLAFNRGNRDLIEAEAANLGLENRQLLRSIGKMWLVTLPVEIDASNRAKALLESQNIVRSQEQKTGIARVLTSPASTYVAGADSAIGTLLYFALVALKLVRPVPNKQRAGTSDLIMKTRAS